MDTLEEAMALASQEEAIKDSASEKKEASAKSKSKLKDESNIFTFDSNQSELDDKVNQLSVPSNKYSNTSSVFMCAQIDKSPTIFANQIAKLMPPQFQMSYDFPYPAFRSNYGNNKVRLGGSNAQISNHSNNTKDGFCSNNSRRLQPHDPYKNTIPNPPKSTGVKGTPTQTPCPHCGKDNHKAEFCFTLPENKGLLDSYVAKRSKGTSSPQPVSHSDTIVLNSVSNTGLIYKIKIDEYGIDAILDTGAGISVINQQVVDKIQLFTRISVISIATKIILKSCHGTMEEATQQIEYKVTLSALTLPIKFIVSRALAPLVIIGTKDLHQFKVKIDMEDFLAANSMSKVAEILVYECTDPDQNHLDLHKDYQPPKEIDWFLCPPLTEAFDEQIQSLVQDLSPEWDHENKSHLLNLLFEFRACFSPQLPKPRDATTIKPMYIHTGSNLPVVVAHY